eukprot:4258020-Pyramimonas_sp.AAC.2
MSTERTAYHGPTGQRIRTTPARNACHTKWVQVEPPSHDGPSRTERVCLKPQALPGTNCYQDVTSGYLRRSQKNTRVVGRSTGLTMS